MYLAGATMYEHVQYKFLEGSDSVHYVCTVCAVCGL